MQACRREKVGRGPGARAGRALGGLKGAAQMVGVPCAVGEQEAEGKVSSQILVSSDSQSATGLGTRKGRGLASPGGSHLGQQRGPSLRAPRPLAGQFLDRPAGGAQHLPPAGPRTWQEPMRTQELLGRREPCL